MLQVLRNISALCKQTPLLSANIRLAGAFVKPQEATPSGVVIVLVAALALVLRGLRVRVGPVRRFGAAAPYGVPVRIVPIIGTVTAPNRTGVVSGLIIGPTFPGVSRNRMHDCRADRRPSGAVVTSSIRTQRDVPKRVFTGVIRSSPLCAAGVYCLQRSHDRAVVTHDAPLTASDVWIFRSAHRTGRPTSPSRHRHGRSALVQCFLSPPRDDADGIRPWGNRPLRCPRHLTIYKLGLSIHGVNRRDPDDRYTFAGRRVCRRLLSFTSIAPPAPSNGSVGTPLARPLPRWVSAVGGTFQTSLPGTLRPASRFLLGGVLSGTPTRQRRKPSGSRRRYEWLFRDTVVYRCQLGRYATGPGCR